MKLYHGTSFNHWDSIRRRGLRQRGRARGNWEQYPSIPHHVYLTEVYPIYFARATSAARPKNRRDGLLLEVDTDLLAERNMWPDEDSVAQALTAKFGLPTDVAQKDAIMHLPQHREDGQDWRWSLKALGTCAHAGTIPPSAITRAWRLRNMTDMCWLMTGDPTISLMGYRYTAHRLAARLAWVMSAPDQRLEALDTMTVLGDVGGDSARLVGGSEQLDKMLSVQRQSARELSDMIEELDLSAA